MGMITAIRERTGVLATMVLGGLLIFLFGQNFYNIKVALMRKNARYIGKIAGKSIDIQEYSRRLEQAKHRFRAQYGQLPGDEFMQVLIADQVWRQLIEEYAYGKEYELLDLKVTNEELVDMVQGDHLHEAIKQYFIDEKTGKFNKEKLIKYLKGLNSSNEKGWYQLENYLRKARLHEKFIKCLEGGTYVNSLEAQQYLEKKDYKIACLYIPYYTVEDKEIEVNEKMLQAYLKTHKDAYQVDQTRGIYYVRLPIKPSKEDKQLFEGELLDLKNEFKNSKDSKAFAQLNTEGAAYSTYGVLKSQDLPKELKGKDLRKGSVVGPIYTGNKHARLYKVVDIKSGKEGKKYTLAIIERRFFAGDTTRDEVLRKAEELKSAILQPGQFIDRVNEAGFKVEKALKITSSTSYLPKLPKARELIKWLYNKASIGKVSPIFEIGDQYVIAMMVQDHPAGTASLEQVRDEVYDKVKNEEKAKYIISKLKSNGKSLLEMAKAYGEHAKIIEATGNFSNESIKGIGKQLYTWGKVAGMSVGEISLPYAEANGVMVVNLLNTIKKNKKETIEDLKKVLQENRKVEQKQHLLETFSKLSNVKDYRYKYY